MTLAVGIAANLATATVNIRAWWWPLVIWIVTGILLVATIAIEIIRQRSTNPLDDDPSKRLDRAADLLASAVAEQWKAESAQRRVHDPFPLPVRWTKAERLMDYWANIAGTAGPVHTSPSLDGKLDEIVRFYSQIPSGRLLVLGRAGSGKTILAVRFAIDYLALRAKSNPVPVIFSLGSWDPTAISLRDWLVARLVEDYPGLAASDRSTSNLAADLIRAEKILPILDGFDEIASDLQSAALKALNLTTMPLLVTSRTDEYAAAARNTTVLRAAVAIELASLKLKDLKNYLPRTTHQTISTGGRLVSIWTPVLRALSARPTTTAAANLSQVLTTPLMVALARSIYSDNPGRDPAELLDQLSYPSPKEIEEHLFASFIPAIYQQLPFDASMHNNRKRYKNWNSERTERWLCWLAHHLDVLNTQDLAWWRLGDSIPRPARVIMGGLETGIAAVPIFGLVFGVRIGLVFGLLGGLLVALSMSTSTGPKPSHVQLRISGSMRRFARGVIGGKGPHGILFGGVTVGLMVGLVGWIVAGISGGLSAGIGILCVNGLLEVLNAPIDITSIVTPRRLLIDDRNNTFVHAFVIGLLAMLGFIIVAGDAHWSSIDVLARGFVFAVGVGWGSRLGATAWGRWFILVRFWLPITRRLPWRIVSFLSDAHMRGVLRQAGPVYQFRHAGIQHYLSTFTPVKDSE